MFVTNPDLQSLRQGDIVRGLLYPYMDCESLQVMATLNNETEDETFGPGNRLFKKYGKPFHDAVIPALSDYCIVLSHCCDLQVQEGQVRPAAPAFVIAPLFPIPNDVLNDSRKLANFRQNSHHYQNSFYLETVMPLCNNHAWVDFNRMVSIPISNYKRALNGKVLQMTDAIRVRFKTKLGLHFARPTNEERVAGLYPVSFD